VRRRKKRERERRKNGECVNNIELLLGESMVRTTCTCLERERGEDKDASLER
jgi:hypothetical protein